MKVPSYLAFGGILVNSFFILSTSSFAQGRVGGMAGAHISAHISASPAMAAPHGVAARMAAMPRIGVASRPGTVISRVHIVNGVIHVTRRRVASASVPNTNGSFSPFLEDEGIDFDNAPGLGFDFPHLAATRPREFGRRHRATIGSFVPFFDGGFFFPPTPVVVDDETEAAQNESEPVRTTRRVRREWQEAPAAPTESANDVASQVPLDNTQYVFVRRDGSVFFAVAYSWEKGTLRYITNLGTRGSVDRNALDLEATRRFNEQRGLSFSFPA